MTDELSPDQEEVMARLPASLEELADAFSITKSGVRSRVDRIRAKGVDVLYDDESGKYYPPVDAPEIPEESVSEAAAPREEVVHDLRNGGLTFSDFAHEYDLTKHEARSLIEDLQATGTPIDFKTTDTDGTKLWYVPEGRDKVYKAGDGSGTYRFALISDTHLGSSAEHLPELHDFYDRLVEEGIDTVYHAGDITDGWEVHKGHINAIKGEAAGWSRLLDYTVENYPQRDGITTFFIEGNHDRKYWKRNGLRLGKILDNRREDLKYCGDCQARFVFDHENDIDLELIHPSGGKPYTQGYRAQTLYRERPADERPTLGGIGHLHGKLYAKAEGVEAFYTGCWKGLTTYGKRKGHASEIGGWIVEIEIEDGELRRLTPDWIGYESRDATEAVSASEIAEETGNVYPDR